MNSKLRDIVEEAALDYSLSSRTDSKEVVITEAEKAIRQAVGEEMLGRLPSDENVTTKYGYYRDEKKYGYRLAITDVKQMIKEWSQS